MGLTLDYTDGQTPLDEEERDGLLIPTISTRAELDQFEQQQIEDAVQWTMTRAFSPQAVLTEAFVRSLHKRMFGNIWSWAGEFRKSNKNLGVDKWRIAIELKNLLDDAHYWIRNSVYPGDEVAIRFKHRIVCIHCFTNGNGRHSRLMADVLTEKVFQREVFSWGANDFLKEGEARSAYLSAIKAADAGDYGSLLQFARS
jgi:Fic-DOC domain mobile mystery protein B